jgi:hypothetical protein
MSVPDETIWRAALERRGKDWVARELRSRFGRPGDELLDVTYEQPHPTREFCQKWCAEQENRMFSMSGHTKVVIVALIVLFAVTGRAVEAWVNYQPLQQGSTNPLPRPARGGGTTLQDPANDSVDQVNGRATSSPSRTSISSCTYATYPTAQCPSR